MTATKCRVILLAIALILCSVAFLLFLRVASPSKQIPITAFEDIDAALVRDGFKLDQNVTTVDQIALGPVTGLATRLIPGVQKRSASRVYLRNGAKLGIDFTCSTDSQHASNVSISCDPPNTGEAHKITRALAALNPNLPLSLRTNFATVSAK